MPWEAQVWRRKENKIQREHSCSKGTDRSQGHSYSKNNFTHVSIWSGVMPACSYPYISPELEQCWVDNRGSISIADIRLRIGAWGILGKRHGPHRSPAAWMRWWRDRTAVTSGWRTGHHTSSDQQHSKLPRGPHSHASICTPLCLLPEHPQDTYAVRYHRILPVPDTPILILTICSH